MEKEIKEEKKEVEEKKSDIEKETGGKRRMRRKRKILVNGRKKNTIKGKKTGRKQEDKGRGRRKGRHILVDKATLQEKCDVQQLTGDLGDQVLPQC